MKRAFTLVEFLLVVSIIATIGATSAPYIGRFLANRYLATAADGVVRTLRKAQIYSLNGKQDSVWGVHYEPTLLVLFRGDDYGTRDSSFDEKFTFSQTVEIVGLADVYFQKLRGEPSGTPTIVISALNEQRTVVINSEGMVDVQ